MAFFMQGGDCVTDKQEQVKEGPVFVDFVQRSVWGVIRRTGSAAMKRGAFCAVVALR